ncbi:virB8 family protein [Eoetvoesiella caeni]|uniref:Type IV secretion system protein VirB8 n=1 Tax=Eoetvoesiella caeni TaxID=645616 RepID=A0A366H1X9_9BURK|nr:VirB8/TrbF family protein [Eoetvoesiella caeni]MCI2811013.1 VirB8/TrbF family protein [Eoetvoesiella caeni]NYT56913.1 conjugal transfer protein TraJ [Eoetvoesiella caeni]RBP35237.1 type IV secretion system protein VirB8 [Eoetvoesiella caeni]
MSDPLKSEDIAAYLEQSRGLERDHLGELVRSRKRAWQVAIASGLIAFASVAAVAGLTPLKQPPEMYVVRVDNATGTIEHVSSLGQPMEDYGQRIAKYFLNTYVLNCEGYSWQTIQEQFNTCALLSSAPTQIQYGKRFEGPDAVTTRLGAQSSVDVQVHSITLGANQAAIVRFTKTEREVSTGNISKVRHLIATMAYQYTNVPLTEEVARLNPLGFQIMRYDLAADLSR